MSFNHLVIVKQSSIPGAGKGVFAATDIKKGQQITQYKGKLVTKQLSQKIGDKHRKTKEVWLFQLNDYYDIDGSRGGNEARFINHSHNPNCEPVNYDDEEVWIEALRNIKKGEELFYDYGFDEDQDEDYPWYKASKPKHKETKK